MVDAVTVTKLFDGHKYCAYEFLNVSDGTGESLVKKIDRLDLMPSGGGTVQSLTLIDASWDVSGFTYVNMLWDRNPSAIVVETMTGNSGVCYDTIGDKHDPNRMLDGTGNILITTSGGATGSSYRVSVLFKKKWPQ